MIVTVPNVGEVEFPDTMSPEEVGQHSQRLYGQAMVQRGYKELPGAGYVGLLPGSAQQPKPRLLTEAPPPRSLGDFGRQLIHPLGTVNTEMIDKAFSGGPLDRFVGGVGKGALNLVAAGTTPAFAAIPAVNEVPGIGPAALKMIALGFGGKMLADTAKDLSTGVTASKLGEAAVNVPAGVLGAVHGIKGLGELVKPTEVPLSPQAWDSSRLTAYDQYEGARNQTMAPLDRQLTGRNTYQVAPQGTAVDVNQLSPKELTEFQREAQSRALHQGGSAQEAMVKASLGKLGKPAVSSPSQINELLGVGRKTPVMGVKESPNYEQNQEMPFNEVFNNLTRKEGIGNFFVKIGNEVHPFDTIQQAEESFTAARRASKLPPEELAKKGPFEVFNAAKQHIGTIDSEGKFELRGFQPPPGQGPPETEGVPQLRGPTPLLPAPGSGPVQQLDKPQSTLPPEVRQTETPERKPALLAGGHPPVVSLAKELGLKLAQWAPEMGGKYSLTDPKTGFTIEGLGPDVTKEEVQARFAAKTPGATVPKTTEMPTSYQPAVRTPDGKVVAGNGHDALPPGQRGFQGNDGKFYSLTEVARNEQQRKTQLNESKTKEKGSAVQAPGILPKQGVQPQGSGGAREGGGAGNGKGEKVQAKPQDEVKPKEEVLGPGGIGKGIKAAVEKNKTDESGSFSLAPLKEAYDKSVDMGEKLMRTIATDPFKLDVFRYKDVADNAANTASSRAGASQRVLAKVLFGKDNYKRAENGATAAIETRGDKNELDRFISIAKKANDQKALEAATFAKNNWDKIQPLVKNAQRHHDFVYDRAIDQGIKLEKREGYIKHSIDITKLPHQMADTFFGEKGGSGGSYKKERKFQSLYDLVEAGHGKAIRNWNSSELMENRIRAGFHEINDLWWAKSFAGVKEPTTGKSLVSLEEKTGYVPWSPQPGKTFYIHRGYEGAFESASALSALRRGPTVFGVPVGEGIMKAHGSVKHSFFMFDTYHAIKVGAKMMSFTGKPYYSYGRALLEYNPSDLANAVKAGEITQELADRANKERAVANLGMSHGFNVGRIAEAMDADWLRKLNPLGMGTANKWIFEKLARSAMIESYNAEYQRLNPEGYNRLTSGGKPTTQDINFAKKISRDLNFNFGSIGRQGVGFLRSATMQDLSRLLILAPQWVESMAQTETRSIGQAVKAPFTGKVGTLAKGTGVILVAMLAATQVANIASQGHPTWDNEEGHKLDAKIGDQWVSPFSLPMELTHDVLRYHRKGDSPLQTLGQMAANKSSFEIRAAKDFLTQKDYTGRQMTDKETLITTAKDLLPAPLPFQAAANIKTKGLKQGLAMVGIKSETTETPKQRVQQLARKFEPKTGTYPVSQYTTIKQALEKNDVETAKTEYQKLIKGKTEKEVANVEQYFKELPETIHTGSKEKEQAFYDGLSDEDKKLYQEVRKENRDLSEKFFDEVLGHSPKMSRTKRKRFSAFTYENE